MHSLLRLARTAVVTVLVLAIPAQFGFVGTAARAAEEKTAAKTAAKTPHDGKEEHKTAVPLDPQPDLALWSLVVFLVFVFVLWKFAWGPLSKALDDREAKIAHDIAAAESARKKAEQMLADHERKLAGVQDEVREIIAEARRDADHTKQDIMATAQKEADASKNRAISEINRAKEAALKELFDTMAGQVADATEFVLGRSVTDQDQGRLINEALSQFSQGS